jgi:hypothetical protein
MTTARRLSIAAVLLSTVIAVLVWTSSGRALG